jgi:hypothetical protein
MIPAVIVPARIKAQAKADTPAIPGIVMHAKSPGIRPGPVAPAIPGTIMPAGSPYHGAAADIIAHIAGSIPYIHVLRGALVYIHIPGIVGTVADRYLLYIGRAFIGHLPGPLSIIADKPDAVFKCIIAVIGRQHYCNAAVLCKGQLGIFYGYEFWRAIIAHFAAGGIAVNPGRLWHPGINQCLIGFLRAGHAGQHTIFF